MGARTEHFVHEMSDLPVRLSSIVRRLDVRRISAGTPLSICNIRLATIATGFRAAVAGGTRRQLRSLTYRYGISRHINTGITAVRYALSLLV
jgi:hypothetical protein